MQVFRLMGMPDKVIGFDSLPESMVKDFEMINAAGFPRHWKEWLGTKNRTIKIAPEKDNFTGQMRTFEPIKETDSYFYIVDSMLNPCMEKWKDVLDYVKVNVKKDFVLRENIEEMAKPLAADKLSGVTLEPEDVVIIPLVDKTKIEPEVEKEEIKKEEVDFGSIKCEEEGCLSTFTGKYAHNSYMLHLKSKHKKEL